MPHPPRPCFAQVWLATPAAADRFDPARLGEAELATWAAIRTRRRRRDWASSRALMAAALPVAGAPRSLSHSHGHAAIAFAPAQVAVGVDIEWVAPRNLTGMASTVYTDTECRYLASIEDADQSSACFYEFWTMKEALAKALRLPLADALRQCRLVDDYGVIRPVLPTANAWRIVVFAPQPRLRLAVAVVTAEADLLDGCVTMTEWPPLRCGDWHAIIDLASKAPARTAC
jgi:hypothetical protein